MRKINNQNYVQIKIRIMMDKSFLSFCCSQWNQTIFLSFQNQSGNLILRYKKLHFWYLNHIQTRQNIAMNFSFKKKIPTIAHKNIMRSRVEERNHIEIAMSEDSDDRRPTSPIARNPYSSSHILSQDEMERQKDYYKYLLSLLNRMQPRDQRIVIPFPHFKNNTFSLENQKNLLERWIGEMYFRVVSSSFKMLTDKTLTYEQAKVFSSENMLLNLLMFFENVSDAEVFPTMRHINITIKDCLSYLTLKYPQMKEIKPNKKLRESISSLNNLANDENDMILRSGVIFERKPSDDYTSEVMLFFNYLVGLSSEKCFVMGKETTFAKGFFDFFEKIFEWVEFPEQIIPEDTIYQILTKVSEKVQSEKQEESEQNFSFDSMEEDSETSLEMQNQNFEQNIMFEQIEAPQFLQQSEKNLKMPKKFSPSKKSKKRQRSAEIKKRKASIHYLENEVKNMDEKQVKEYREKIRKFTSYKIGTKINPNTELFSEQEIKNGRFKIKNTAILRVLTKWIEELEKKIFHANKEISGRSFRFKTKNNQFIKLNSSEKNKLFQNAQKQIPIVKQFIESILDDCIKIEASIAKSNRVDNKMYNIPKFQFLVGNFCSKLESAASTYLINYLNRIIQALLSIPEESEDEVEGKNNFEKKCREVNLVTFKISDLLRCKCSSHENEILRIINLIKRVSENFPDLLKIVRIKDRLEMGTRDILINILYMGKVLGEIQLAVTDQVDEKQQFYDHFNHYLYELKRSNLGPIMESSCIWTHLDQRSKHFKDKKIKREVDQSKLSYRRHGCPKKNLQEYRYAMVCSICNIFYPGPEGVLEHVRCSSCDNFYECSLCLEEKMGDEQLKEYLGLLKGDLKYFSHEFVLWKKDKFYELPKFAIFIPRNSKKIEYIFAEKIMMKGTIYYVMVKEEGIKTKVNILVAINEEEQIKKTLKNFFIYEWNEKRNFNRTLKAQSHIEKINAEAIRKEQEKMDLEIQRQKVKEDVRRRRKIEEKKWMGLEKIEEDSSDEEKKQAKEEKIQNQSKTEKDKTKNKQAEQNNIMKNILFQNIGKVSKKQIPSSRPGSANSGVSSTFSKNNRRAQFLREGEKEVNIEIFAKRSQTNDVRITFHRVKSTMYYLILNCYLSEGVLKVSIKEQMNKDYVKELFDKKNEVLFLEEERIQKELVFSPEDLRTYRKSFSTVSEIYIDENMIKDINFLSDFPRLQVLHANHNYIRSMAPLTKLKNLTEVMMANNEIRKIEGLENSKKLSTLNLSKNEIKKIQNISENEKLKVLSLSYNLISQIQNISGLKGLKELYLTMNNISKIEGLETLGKLETLSISLNNVEKIEGLEGLNKLTELDLSGNRIQNIEGLSNLNSLKKLDLKKNQIKIISGILGLKELEYLNLFSNELKKIQGIQELTKLKELNIERNHIPSIDYTAIENLAQLYTLNISDNSVVMIPKDVGTFLPNLCELSMLNNPFKKTKMENKKSIDMLRQILKGFTLKAN